MRYLLLAALMAVTTLLMSQDYKKEYAELAAAQKAGKPRTALTVARAFYAKATKAGDYDHAVKALAHRMTYLGQTEEEGQDAAIRLLQTELAAAPDRNVVAPVLHYMLGTSYYNYARQNSYRLRNATAVTTDSVPAATRPLADWNLQQLKDAAENQFYQALDLARNQKTRLTTIPAITSGDGERLNERPTLYDLLVRESLNMLGSPLLTVTDPEVLDPARYLGDAAAFVATPVDIDPASGTYRKLKLYQELTNYHLGPPVPALLAVELDRLEYVRGLGVKTEDYLAAVRRMQTTYANTPGGEILLVREATIYAGGSDDVLGDRPKAEALAILDRVKDKSPVVANAAEQLRRRILTQRLDVNVRDVYGKEDNLLISVRYQNLRHVYHRLYPAPKFGPDEELRPWRINEENLARMLKQEPLATKDFRLPANDDYASHTTETWLSPVKAGRYYLVTSNEADFDPEKGQVAVANFQVSDLAVVKIAKVEDGHYQVLDRKTGAPRSGVRVELQQSTDGRNNYRTVKIITTGDDGRVGLPGFDRGQLRFLLSDRENNDELVVDGGYQYNGRAGRDSRRYALTPLFTDRAIYRPGQTVRVYGLTWEKNPEQMPEMLTNEKRTLTLKDVNYQEVGKAELISDAYSRFHAEFKLPEGGLTGVFHLQTEGGNLNFRVEEYKRPRFTVELEGPDYAVAEAETEIKGTAKLYAGPVLDGARVNYRVFLEEVSYWWWGRGRGNGNEKELVADGKTTTDGSGEFAFAFTPDKQAGKGRKRYRFVVEADVSDDTGETHAASTRISLRGEQPVIALRPSDDKVDVADSLTILAAGAEENLEVLLTIVPVIKPGTGLADRRWGFPDRPVLTKTDYEKRFPELAGEETPELGAWPINGAPVYTGRLAVVDGEAKLDLAARDWPVGHYRLEWSYPDGTAGEASTFAVLDTDEGKLPAGMKYHLRVEDRNARIGETLQVTLVSARTLPHVLALWSSRKGNKWANTSSAGKAVFSYTPTEEDRGGIALDVAFLRFGEEQQFNERFNLGWDNKKLTIDYATFRDKLRPGTPERWTLTVKNADGTPVAAAALASMYDASLDDVTSGVQWGFSPWPMHYGGGRLLILLDGGTTGARGQSNFRWPELPRVPELPGLDLAPFDGKNFGHGGTQIAYSSARTAMMNRTAAPMNEMDADGMSDGVEMEEMAVGAAAPPPPPPAPGEPAPEAKAEEAPVQIRKNLQETAFWMPDLASDADGNLVISFDSPEALTSWKFRLFAHDKDLATAVSEQTIVTQKELMVLPNVPRFVREGDEIGLTVRVNNMTEAAMDVTVTLEFFDPVTNKALTSLGAAAGAGGGTREQSIAAGSGEGFSFPLTIPEGLSSDGPIGYRIIARAAGFSDGEENIIPVLTDRTLITVGKPFYLKKKDKKTVEIPVLANNDSKTLRHVGYTFQATTNPAWLALKSLPYLMEYPYDCTEQLANRYFANQLAYATVSRKPILEEVFRQWQDDPDALKSELEQNASLKNALLTETPWLREAEDEAKQRARIGELFDLKRLAEEQVAALDKLAFRQNQAGFFSWFPGGRENRYMTQYVVETLARLRQLGVVTPDQTQRVAAISQSAVLWLDQELKEDYQQLLRRMKNEQDWKKNYRPSSTVVHYLYARTLSGARVSQDKGVSAALTFYAERAGAKWLDYGLYEQALLTVTDATQNGQNAQLARTIMESLRERALQKDEFGMFWKYGRGYRWQNLPIETHCRLIEAFRVAGGSTDELDEMRLWLLTNKRTNRWETTKSTAAAVFALLNTGTDWTDGPGKPLEVSWPNTALKASLASRVRAAQTTAEAATGAFSLSVEAARIDKGLATVKVKNNDNRLVWGGVYWQYTELSRKVKASNDGPLTLERELFRRIPTEDGIRLDPITDDNPLAAGDRVTVRLILRCDRALDYVHLKDRRAATFEPITQTSGYRYDNGLGYYFAPGDLATNFFIDHLPKGTFTLEYDLFATYSGSFSNGLGRVQCMYAPEFGANTDGARIVVE